MFSRKNYSRIVQSIVPQISTLLKVKEKLQLALPEKRAWSANSCSFNCSEMHKKKKTGLIFRTLEQRKHGRHADQDIVVDIVVLSMASQQISYTTLR